MGPGIAKRLNLLQLTYVAKIAELDLKGRSITIERRAEGGVQVLKTRLPCLITMLEATNEMRRGTMADALRAARAEIVTWSAADAGIDDLTKCGLRGSPTVVKRVFAPAARAEKATLVDLAGKDAAASADALIDAVFARTPSLEADMARLSAGF